MAAEGPAGALELGDDGLHSLPLPLAVGLLGIVPVLGVGIGAVAQDALVAGEAQAALGAEGGEVRVLADELIQDGQGVQVLGDHLVALGVLAPAPEEAVVSKDELVGEAVLEHIVIVVDIVVGEDEGLLALRDVEGVADHLGLAVLAGGLAPDVVDVHQDVAVVVDALEDLVVLVHRDHPVVDAVGLAVAVKGQLGIGHHRVEEEMLHDVVPGDVGDAVLAAALGHHLGIGDDVGLGFRGGVGVFLRGGGGAAGAARAAGGGGIAALAAGGQAQQHGCRQEEGEESSHGESPLLV